MVERHEPLPLEDVIELVRERRRRRHLRAARSGLATTAAAALAAGVAVTTAGPRATAPSAGPPTTSPSSTVESAPDWREAAMARWTAGHQTADAEEIAQLWRVDVLTVKAVLGESIATGVPISGPRLDVPEVDRLLAADVAAELIDAYREEFEPSDARLAATAWGVSLRSARFLLGVRALAGLPPN